LGRPTLPEYCKTGCNPTGYDFSYFNAETTSLIIVYGAAVKRPARENALRYAVDRDALREVYHKDCIPATQLVVPNISDIIRIEGMPYDRKSQTTAQRGAKDGVPVDRKSCWLCSGVFPA